MSQETKIKSITELLKYSVDCTVKVLVSGSLIAGNTCYVSVKKTELKKALQLSNFTEIRVNKIHTTVFITNVI